MSLMKDFKEFAVKGNAVDMAVGIIIGGAFGKIVSSLVNDVIMPPIGKLLGNVDFTGLFFNLGSTSYETLAAAKDAGAPTLNYGNFICDYRLRYLHDDQGHECHAEERRRKTRRTTETK